MSGRGSEKGDEEGKRGDESGRGRGGDERLKMSMQRKRVGGGRPRVW